MESNMKFKSVWMPQILAVTTAAIFFAAFLQSALPRIFYPYDLDFLEDSVLMQSERIAQGLPVYLAPNANFNPHVYMPLYFWLGAVLLKTFGTGFTPLL